MRHIYKELRAEFVKSLRTDLIGPYEVDEEIKESPISSYIMGRLSPCDEDVIITDEEMTTGSSDENDDSEEVESDQETVHVSKNKQSSIGLKAYVDKDTQSIKAIARWADYKSIEEEGKHFFKRFQKEEEMLLDITRSNVEGICLEKGVYISWVIHTLNTKNMMVSVYLENKRVDVKESTAKHIYQVELVLDSIESEAFLSENLAYGKMEEEDYFFNKKPIFSRGYGCAAVWEGVSGNYTRSIRTDFLPEQEISGMDADLEKYKNYFSMYEFSVEENKESTLSKLSDILGDYAVWISRLESHEYMKDDNYVSYGKDKINLCNNNLDRMIEGLNIIKNNPLAFKAFLFMNNAMHLSRSMALYSKEDDESKSLEDYMGDHSYWRPFQIGFILLNIKGIVDPTSDDRDIVDLLYFPTGGGKTEAYLGIIAFLMAYRRLSNDQCDEYEKDGGVTVIVRYTLRLLTTQQRDRMLRLLAACEYIRSKSDGLFGKKEFAIGFWVGSGVTVNKYKDLIVTQYNSQSSVDFKKRSLKSQILKCPCCGATLDLKTSYHIDVDNRSFKIFCPNSVCFFNERSIPVYLIDEDVYNRTPTVIIGTVDKFARLTFEERVHLIFGRRSVECTDCGSFLETDKELIKECGHKAHILEGKQKFAKPFYPPELILQDELHLITGPLGTIYGSYEMAVDELSEAVVDGSKIKPKYIASTATIKNADHQINSLYARNTFNQFPPSGHDSDDSYFAREKDLEEHPFRLYVGVSSPYTSMKTTILRVYAVLLQTAMRYRDHDLYKDYIDAYWTLMGYYNSKRELGGAIRLIQDDIPDRIKVLQQKNDDELTRYINNYAEITSRVNSWEIPRILENLEQAVHVDKYPYDVAVATNMIQVGMDVDRLGLMAVTGQPKTTAEYIQASSRIGRQSPGLVVTIYNPYRARDLSHYENFTAYHSHLYRFVEGTSATPFSARARERALHASFVGMLRGTIDELRTNKTGAQKVEYVNADEIEDIIERIAVRIEKVDPDNLEIGKDELRYFLDEWIKIARRESNLRYYVHENNMAYKTKKIHRLLKGYGSYGYHNYEKETLNSMRSVQKESSLYLWEE